MAVNRICDFLWKKFYFKYISNLDVGRHGWHDEALRFHTMLGVFSIRETELIEKDGAGYRSI